MKIVSMTTHVPYKAPKTDFCDIYTYTPLTGAKRRRNFLWLEDIQVSLKVGVKIMSRALKTGGNSVPKFGT